MSAEVFLWQVFITFLVIIDPFAVVPNFISLTHNDSREEKKYIARKACLISLILLLTFAFVGDSLLDAMKISEPAFRITGGILLFLSGLDMVRQASPRPRNQAETKEIRQKEDVSVFPLAIPMIAGPGALTSMVVLMRQAETKGWVIEGCVALLAVLVLAITYVCLLLAQPIMRILGVTGTNVLTRVFGIILCAVAMQGVIDGAVLIMR